MTARCVAQCEGMAAVQRMHRAAMPGMEHCSMAMAEPEGDVVSRPMQCAHTMQHPSLLPAVDEKRMDATPLVVVHAMDVAHVHAPVAGYRAEESEVVHAPPPLERSSVLRI